MDIQQNKTNQLSYRLKQYLGIQSQYQITPEQDKISAFQFSQQSNYSSIGDNSGRLIIFQQNKESGQFQYLTEVMAHNVGHDWQKNQEISSKINDIKWMKSFGTSINLITTNDKFIKIWKVKDTCKKFTFEQQTFKSENFIPKLRNSQQIEPTLINKNQLPNLHLGKIKHIELSDNQQYLISSDDQRVKKWCLQKYHKPLLIFDNTATPKDIDLNQMQQQQDQWNNLELITNLKFHGKYDNRFAYSTKLGQVNYFDMRSSNKCIPSIVLRQKMSQKFEYVQKYLKCVSDFCFNPLNQFELMTRDYLNVYLWDMRNGSNYTKKMSVYPSLAFIVSQLFQSWNIYDQFKLAIDPKTQNILTSHYSKCFHEMNFKNTSNIRYKIDFEDNAIGEKVAVKGSPLKDFKTDPRISCVKYNNRGDTIGVTSNNCIFFYER